MAHDPDIRCDNCGCSIEDTGDLLCEDCEAEAKAEEEEEEEEED